MCYQCFLGVILIPCIANHKIHKNMSEVHFNECGPHQSGRKLYMQLKWWGYYWLAMICDCNSRKYAKYINVMKNL